MIEIGDSVIFSVGGNYPLKRGQVIDIKDDLAKVFVSSEKKVYDVQVSRLKKE